MISAASFKGRQVAVFGLGGSGRVSVAALKAGGAEVSAWDDNPATLDRAQTDGLPIVDLKSADWSQFAALILAPGVPLTHPAPHWTVGRAGAAGVPVLGDLEVFCRERRRAVPNAPFVAITGTNGKSTTTALIGHLLAATGRDAQIGGNIGTPVLELEPPGTGRYHVIEASSYQIDLAPTIDPSIGVLLNVTPDHLDRHGTFENYATVKERLVRGAGIAVIGVDDPIGQSVADRLEQAGKQVDRLSVRRPLSAGFYRDGDRLVEVRDGASTTLASLSSASALRGEHNAQNALAAAAVVKHLGLRNDEIQKGLSSFPGLAHRMEEVGRRGRVLYVNDSKATNADAAARALACFERIYWIAGGRAKAGGIDDLVHFFPRIARAYLIGEAAEALGAVLGPDVPHADLKTLDAAVKAAAEDAEADASAGEVVVLLSPACASFDQYRNFEIRGDAFREAVLSLDGVVRREEAA